MEGPETWENPTQLFIYNIIQAHTAFGRDIIYYIIDVCILYYLDIGLQVSGRSSRSVLKYLIEHGQKLCVPPDGIMNKRLLPWYYIIKSNRSANSHRCTLYIVSNLHL